MLLKEPHHDILFHKGIFFFFLTLTVQPDIRERDMYALTREEIWRVTLGISLIEYILVKEINTTYQYCQG